MVAITRQCTLKRDTRPDPSLLSFLIARTAKISRTSAHWFHTESRPLIARFKILFAVNIIRRRRCILLCRLWKLSIFPSVVRQQAFVLARRWRSRTNAYHFGRAKRPLLNRKISPPRSLYGRARADRKKGGHKRDDRNALSRRWGAKFALMVATYHSSPLYNGITIGCIVFRKQFYPKRLCRRKRHKIHRKMAQRMFAFYITKQRSHEILKKGVHNALHSHKKLWIIIAI